MQYIEKTVYKIKFFDRCEVRHSRLSIGIGNNFYFIIEIKYVSDVDKNHCKTGT